MAIFLDTHRPPLSIFTGLWQFSRWFSHPKKDHLISRMLQCQHINNCYYLYSAVWFKYFHICYLNLQKIWIVDEIVIFLLLLFYRLGNQKLWHLQEVKQNKNKMTLVIGESRIQIRYSDSRNIRIYYARDQNPTILISS